MVSDLSLVFLACSEPGPWQLSQTKRSRSLRGLARKALACRVSVKCVFSWPWQPIQAFSPIVTAADRALAKAVVCAAAGVHKPIQASTAPMAIKAMCLQPA